MYLFRNILELIQFFEDSSYFYLVFEKLRGGKYEIQTVPPAHTWHVFFISVSQYFQKYS